MIIGRHGVERGEFACGEHLLDGILPIVLGVRLA